MKYWAPAIALLLLTAGSAAGHPMAPSLLDLRSAPDGAVRVLWKTPLRSPDPGSAPAPRLPEACRALTRREIAREKTALTTRWTVRCGPEGLAGTDVGVSGLTARGAGAVLRVDTGDGNVLRALLDAKRPTVRVPERSGWRGVILDYLRLGIEHLWFGLDHVLFVLGLLLLIGGHRALLVTLTAFTLGHSATLAVVTLGWASVPSAPVEAAIAATLVALALDLVPRARNRRGLFGAHPERVAALFGLLHGLGFASALTGVGLPRGDVLPALAAFNVGIELGQIGLVAAALAAGALFRPLLSALPPHGVRAAAAYALGAVASFWLLDRTLAAL